MASKKLPISCRISFVAHTSFFVFNLFPISWGWGGEQSAPYCKEYILGCLICVQENYVIIQQEIHQFTENCKYLIGNNRSFFQLSHPFPSKCQHFVLYPPTFLQSTPLQSVSSISILAQSPPPHQTLQHSHFTTLGFVGLRWWLFW